MSFEEKLLRRKGLEKRCKLSDLPAALILASRPHRQLLVHWVAPDGVVYGLVPRPSRTALNRRRRPAAWLGLGRRLTLSPGDPAVRNLQGECPEATPARPLHRPYRAHACLGVPPHTNVNWT